MDHHCECLPNLHMLLVVFTDTSFPVFSFLRFIPPSSPSGPWLNNCVGLNNYRYFYCFLLWTTIGTGYVTALLYPVVLLGPQPMLRFHRRLSTTTDLAGTGGGPMLTTPKSSWTLLQDHDSQIGFFIIPNRHQSHNDHALPDIRRKLSYVPSGIDWKTTYDSIDNTLSLWRHDPSVLVLIFIFSFSISLAVSILLALHTYLLLSAQTTLEFFMSFPIRRKLRSDGRKYFSPYNRGYLVNIKQVFGYHLPWYVSMVVPSCQASVPPAVPPTGNALCQPVNPLARPMVEMV